MIVILGLCFLLTDWLSFAEGEGVCLKCDVQGQEGGRILDVAGQVWMGSLENWKIFMDVIFVSSLMFFSSSTCESVIPFSANFLLNSRIVYKLILCHKN